MQRKHLRRTSAVTIRKVTQRNTPTAKPLELLPVQLEKQIWDNMKAKERTSRVAECLAKHEIGPDQRAKMIGWMVEVMSELGCATQTLFVSVRCLDLYFARHRGTLPLSHLHLAGMTAMFVASKFEDVMPISMHTLQKDIGHMTFSKAQLKKSELRMLKTLGFDLDFPTTLDFLGVLCENLSVSKVLVHCAVSVAVIAQITYNGLRFSQSQQGAACLVIAAISTRQRKLVGRVLEESGFTQADLAPAVECLHSAVLQFPKRYPKLKGPLECLHCTIVGKTPLFKFSDEALEAAQQQLLTSFN